MGASLSVRDIEWVEGVEVHQSKRAGTHYRVRTTGIDAFQTWETKRFLKVGFVRSRPRPGIANDAAVKVAPGLGALSWLL